MTTRMRVKHLSRYVYDHPVSASFNEARLTPLATPWQHPLESTVHVEQATWQHGYVDYWGTEVRVFEALRTHGELLVESNSVVEIEASLMPQPIHDLSWAQVKRPAVRDEFGEFLAQTSSTIPDPELALLAEELAATRSPHETALALCSAVHDQMTYLPGSTGVHTTASEAWPARVGVCQDYAHVVVGALRHIGLPARYVSGYLHPDRTAPTGQAALGESHAWVQWWLDKWTGHDPTNDAEIGEWHVLVGCGRDYRDVPPIRGLIAGSSGAAELDVVVEITRLV
jgi:transglutaminase-like putative cysteine protease